LFEIMKKFADRKSLLSKSFIKLSNS
jgi:hypothetical protein